MLTRDKSEKELLVEAREAESAGNYEKAAGLYKLLIRKNDLEARYYDRLLIIYRKQKDLQAEQDLLNKGIARFEKHFAARAEKFSKKLKQQITRLSQALMKKTGLKENGNEYLPEPLAKWKKRKNLVDKKYDQGQRKKRAV